MDTPSLGLEIIEALGYLALVLFFLCHTLMAFPKFGTAAYVIVLKRLHP